MEYDANTIRTRSLDESVRHGHDAASRIEGTLSALLGDLTGNFGPADANECRPSGLVYSADELASRLEGLSRLAIEVKERVVANKVVGTAQAMNNPNAGNFAGIGAKSAY